MTHDDIVFMNDDDDQRSSDRVDKQHPYGVPEAEIVQDAGLYQHPLPTASVVGHESPASNQAPQPKPLPRSRFGLWFVAWPVVLLLAGTIFTIPYVIEPETEVADSSIEVSQLSIQGKYMLGLVKTAGDENTRDQILASVDAMKEGSWEGRLCHAILIGDLKSPDAAIEQLRELRSAADEADYQPSEQQLELYSTLIFLYEDYARQEWTAPSIDDDQRAQLHDQLGWFGELALTPEQGPEDIRRTELVTAAQTTMLVIVVAAVGVLLTGTGGFVTSILFAVLTFLGKIRSALVPKTVNGNIYIETFAIWFVLFLLISYVVASVPMEVPVVVRGYFSTLSLAALLWPLVRRVSFLELRNEIGLIAKNPIVEVLWGFVCYMATLPLMAIGMILMVVMMTIHAGFEEAKPFEGIQGPSHPIGEWLAQANWLILFQIFILAAVIAPIVEETMFRGVLYRHLRDMTASWRIGISVLASTFVNSLIFAAIHPQGIFGIPVLMSLAIGFSLAREWRGSLIAPMTMHAINNGGVTLLAGFMLSSVFV